MSKNYYPKVKNGRPRTHGGYNFLRFGVIPSGKEHVLKWVDSIACELLADLGGASQVSTAQLLLIREIRQLIAFKLLVDEHLMEHGLFKGPGELQPALSSFYLACSNSIRLGLERLGLKKVDHGELTLEKYIEQKDREAKEKLEVNQDEQETE